MRQGRRGLFAIILIGIMILGLIGCAKKEPTVATIGGERISEPVYRIFLWVAQRKMESIQPNIWDMGNIDGKTPEALAKERALTSITYNIVGNQKAKELGIKLSQEEKDSIALAAQEFVTNNKDFAELFGIQERHYEEFLIYGKLNEKVIAELGRSYIPNQEEIDKTVNTLISEGADAPSATIVHVLIGNRNELGEKVPADKDEKRKQKAEEVLEKALQGEDMRQLAIAYSDDVSVHENSGVYTFKQGELDENLENIVFNKSQAGQVYDQVIETMLGYEIVKVEAIEKVSQLDLKDLAISRIQQSFATNEITEISETISIEKEPLFDEIHIMAIE